MHRKFYDDAITSSYLMNLSEVKYCNGLEKRDDFPDLCRLYLNIILEIFIWVTKEHVFALAKQEQTDKRIL